MKYLLFILCFLLLSIPVSADIIGGIGIGIGAPEFTDPGGCGYYGFQENVGGNVYMRGEYYKLNVGNEVSVDNIGIGLIHYFGMSDTWDLGYIVGADDEFDDGDIGVKFGLEGRYKNIVTDIPLLPQYKNLGLFANIIFFSRNDIARYVQFSVGLSLAVE